VAICLHHLAVMVARDQLPASKSQHPRAMGGQTLRSVCSRNSQKKSQRSLQICRFLDLATIGVVSLIKEKQQLSLLLLASLQKRAFQ
jgi:hypothetical protein